MTMRYFEKQTGLNLSRLSSASRLGAGVMIVVAGLAIQLSQLA